VLGCHTRASVGGLCKLMCKEIHMATNLALDPALLDRAVEVSGERTKKAAVTKALQEFIAESNAACSISWASSTGIPPLTTSASALGSDHPR